jgi:hypothetical protein
VDNHAGNGGDRQPVGENESTKRVILPHLRRMPEEIEICASS